MMAEKKNKARSQVSARLNILFLGVFLLFSALILRLGMVQIVQGESYEEELTHVSNQTARIDAPRGLMYDSYGNVVVDNSMELSVTYTNPGNQKAEDILELAIKLSDFIEVDTENLRFRDKQEYWYVTHSEKERKALIEGKKVDDKDEYQTIIDEITEEMVDGYSKEEEQVIAIFTHMLRGTSGTPQRIKQSITEEEAHVLSEHLDKLPNIDLQRDATREYVYGDTLRQLYGSVGSIQSEKVDDYLANGYARSDLVGNSYLELQYENVLRGTKAEISRTSTRTGGEEAESVVEETLGSRGNDLVLSVDMEYQQLLDEAVEKHVMKNRGYYLQQQEGSAYAIVMNPKTGEILAISGFVDPAGEDESYLHPTGAVNNAFEFGSVVKGASVLTGMQEGVVTPDTVVNDRPLHFNGTPEKKSVTSMGPVNMGTALERSSNVYMFEIAMRMGNYTYNSNIPQSQRSLFGLSVANDVLERSRYYFSQFGLGTQTGIDLPHEVTGITGVPQEPGASLDFMIGQFDTYTTLQIGQYASTIANDGVRMRPRLVKEILEPSINGEEATVVKEFAPEVLNEVDMSKDKLDVVQNGFRRVVTGSRGTASSIKTDVPIAAKTGTAEISVAIGEGDNRQVLNGNNQSFIGYAPYDDPEIAFAVIAPKVQIPRGTSYKIAQSIAQDLVNDYFDLQENREGPKSVDSVMDEVDLFENE